MVSDNNIGSKCDKVKSLTPEQEEILASLKDPDDPRDPKTWTANHPDDPQVFVWDEKQQRQILGAFLTDQEFMNEARLGTEPGYFTANPAHEAIAKIAFQFWDQYHAIPEKSVLFNELDKVTLNSSDGKKLFYKAELNTVLEFFHLGLHSKKYWLNQIRQFNIYQGARKAGYMLLDEIKAGKKSTQEIILETIGHLKEAQKISNDDSGPKILTGEELLHLPDPSWLVHSHFQLNSTGIVYGEYRSLKSFFALEMSLCVAAGLPFLGSYQVVQGPVLYIAGEGGDGIKKRLRAWLQHHNLEKCPAGFHITCHRFNFADPSQAAKLVGMCEAKEIKPILVVIDTLAKNIIGSDNDPEVMNNFSNSMEDIREGLDGACVIAVHHSGKDRNRGPRGYSGLPAGVNTAFELDRTSGGCTVRCEKQKDAAEIEKYGLQEVVVDLGENGDGEQQSSLVLKTTPVVPKSLVPETKADCPLNDFINLWPVEGAVTLAEAMTMNQDWFEEAGWTMKTIKNKLTEAQKDRGNNPHLEVHPDDKSGLRTGSGTIKGRRYFRVSASPDHQSRSPVPGTGSGTGSGLENP